MAMNETSFRALLSPFENGMDLMDLPAPAPIAPTKPAHSREQERRRRYDKANSLSGHRRYGRKLARQVAYLAGSDPDSLA